MIDSVIRLALAPAVCWALVAGSLAWAEPAKSCVGSALTEDPKEFLDLPEGYIYETLMESGKPMSDGRIFPWRPDLNVYIPLIGPRAFLVTSHELAQDKNPEWGTGSLTRLYLVDDKIEESRILAEGMRNNCSGSLTPWGTVLTNEEYPREPDEEFSGEGFVWEVDPHTGKKWKLEKLGRFSHESAVVSKEGVVYMTEDAPGGLLYRFVPKRPGNLKEGVLSAYNYRRKIWIEIRDPFHARHEAVTKLATGFNRLEGLALSHDGRFLYFDATGDPDVTEKPDLYGRIYKLDIKSSKLKVFYEGDGDVLANPDNLIFDKKGRLWIMEDQGEANLDRFGNNEILVMKQDRKTCVFARLRDFSCEPTGPEFSSDGNSFFLSVQCKKQTDRLLRISNRNPKKGLLP